MADIVRTRRALAISFRGRALSRYCLRRLFRENFSREVQIEPATEEDNFHHMSTLTLEQISEEALELPRVERALLAERLAESLESGDDGSLRRMWAQEALRRRDDIRNGRVQAIPGEEALASVHRALASRR